MKTFEIVFNGEVKARLNAAAISTESASEYAVLAADNPDADVLFTFALSDGATLRAVKAA